LAGARDLGAGARDPGRLSFGEDDLYNPGARVFSVSGNGTEVTRGRGASGGTVGRGEGMKGRRVQSGGMRARSNVATG
jgi:hypothetical protein